MSILCAIYLLEGIVMSADSRASTKHTYENVSSNETNIEYKVESDNYQKLFLMKTKNIGISCCGDLFIEGKTISMFLNDFENTFISETDGICEVASKLHDVLLKTNSVTKPQFLICGYDKNISVLFEVTINDLNYQLDVFNKTYPSNGVININPVCRGEIEAYFKLFDQNDRLGYEKTGVGLFTMTIKDGIDFVEYVSDLTCKYQRFQGHTPTCGGNIDILVITKNDAYWYKHKLYNLQ